MPGAALPPLCLGVTLSKTRTAPAAARAAGGDTVASAFHQPQPGQWFIHNFQEDQNKSFIPPWQWWWRCRRWWRPVLYWAGRRCQHCSGTHLSRAEETEGCTVRCTAPCDT